MERLQSVLDDLVDHDVMTMIDTDDVVALSRALSRLEAVVHRQTAAFERHGAWSDSGAQNVSAWLTTACRLERRRARGRVRLGRTLRSLDRVAASFASGRIGTEHVLVLAKANDRSTRVARALDRDEAKLVEWAESLQFHQFARRVQEWLLEVDEEGAERDADRLHDERRLHLSPSYEGRWFVDGVLDPIAGEIVHATLQSISDELFEADWAKATEAVGATPTGEQLRSLTRTPAQRRVDALVEMATRARTAPVGVRRPQPLFTVLVGEATFARTVELASGTTTTPGRLAAWLDDALIERIVFDGPDRVMAVGAQRAFRGALRRAVQVLGRTCSHPCCDRPATRCEVDHLLPVSLGGATTQENGRLFCDFHHALHHRENHPGFRDRRGERAA